MANRWKFTGGNEPQEREKRVPQVVQLIELAAPLQIFVEPETYRLRQRGTGGGTLGVHLSFAEAMEILEDLNKK
jgi:hypothetical protein